MSDDAAVAADNIPLEDGEGASTPLPPELTLPAEPAATPPATEAAPPGETPPAPGPPPDPARAGILAELGRERHENKTLKQFRDQASPILQALQKHPDLLLEIQQRETGAARPAPAPARAPAAAPAAEGPSVEDLTQLATDLVLYKADGSGQPDVDAARRIWQRNSQQVQQAVNAAIAQHVAPMQQTMQRSAAQQAREAIEQTAKAVGADGPELTQILDGFMQSDPSLLTNPQIGVSAIVMARGMKGMPNTPGVGTTPAAPGVPAAGLEAPAPVFTERPGARTPTPVVMAPIEQRAAKARGMTPEAWGAATAPLTTAVKGQQHIVLEND
jgi:hypothetical protein